MDWNALLIFLKNDEVQQYFPLFGIAFLLLGIYGYFYRRLLGVISMILGLLMVIAPWAATTFFL